MTSIKIVQFSRPSTPFPLVHLRPNFFHHLDVGRAISDEPFLPPYPLQMIINQLKENIIAVV